MATFEEMKARIADDLNRSDLTSQIGKAINRAINHYKTYPFYFTEGKQAFTINSSNYIYDSTNSDFPSLFGRVSLITIASGGTTYSVKNKNMQQFQDLNADDSTGIPSVFTQYQNKVWFYPQPDRSMTGTVYYSKTYAALSASSDTNDFTSYAEDLIEARARWWINLRVIKDLEGAQIDKIEETDAFANLQEATTMQAPLEVEPTCF